MNTNKKAVILIDAENLFLNSKDDFSFKPFFSAVAKRGYSIDAIAYGHWNKPSCVQFMSEFAELAIQKKPIENNYRGKNAADMMMAMYCQYIIDVCNDVKMVAIFSGDSDFTYAAKCLRSSQRTVIGIGVKKSVGISLYDACDYFFYTSEIDDSAIINRYWKEPTVPNRSVNTWKISYNGIVTKR
jgi:hypothetical protein